MFINKPFQISEKFTYSGELIKSNQFQLIVRSFELFFFFFFQKDDLVVAF